MYVIKCTQRVLWEICILHNMWDKKQYQKQFIFHFLAACGISNQKNVIGHFDPQAKGSVFKSLASFMQITKMMV